MSGQLVIAELNAFRAVLEKADRAQSQAVLAWSRSTITNALHRLGPVPLLSDAAQRASGAAGTLARALSAGDALIAVEDARTEAIGTLDELIDAVRQIKSDGDLLSCR